MRLLPFLLVLLLAPPAWAQGPLAFHATAHDFGEVEGAHAEVTFAFVNVGDGPLVVREVRASCGCTVPHFTREPVAAGGVGEVTVRFDAAGREGPFHQSVLVVADAGEDEVTEVLTVRGRVRPLAPPGSPRASGAVQGGVRFDTDAADLGRVARGEPVTHRFAFLRTAARPLHITRAYTLPAGAEVLHPEVGIARDTWGRVAVTLPAESLAPGPFEFAVILETDDAEEPVKVLRLSGVAE